jgi:hypothetical protein
MKYSFLEYAGMFLITAYVLFITVFFTACLFRLFGCMIGEVRKHFILRRGTAG